MIIITTRRITREDAKYNQQYFGGIIHMRSLLMQFLYAYFLIHDEMMIDKLVDGALFFYLGRLYHVFLKKLKSLVIDTEYEFVYVKCEFVNKTETH